jgi:hypothetical protein
MPILSPPVEIAQEENKEKAQYLLDVAGKPGFDEFTPVCDDVIDCAYIAEGNELKVPMIWSELVIWIFDVLGSSLRTFLRFPG